MSELNFKYPLDLTGVDSVNRVLGEGHSIGEGFNRLIVPIEGAFYTDGLIVRDTVNGGELVPKDQYLPILFYQEPSERSGKEVCCAIAIVDRSVSTEVEVEYQAVGDVYSNITSLILDKVTDINLDDYNLIWGDLLGNLDVFPGDGDLRELGAIYGFEFVAKALNDLRDAIFFGDIDDHDRLKQVIENKYQLAYNKAVNINDEAEAHYARTDDPHDVTKHQIELGKVDNHPTASVEDDVQGTNNQKYSTPAGIRDSIRINAIEPLNSHINNTDDPHDVTQTQIGLSRLHNWSTPDKATAELGESTEHYMTPLSLSQAIAAQLGDAIEEHVANKSNPHQVTKAQVGLSRLGNYPPASEAEAVEGVRYDRLITVKNAGDAINASAKPLLEEHVNDFNNPHEVTAAQVGLGNVDDVSFAQMQNRYIEKGKASTVTVVGPTQALQGETVEWVITNYDIFTNYDISGDFGDLTVNGDTISKTIDSSTPTGDRTLSIRVGNNTRELPIKIIGRGVNKPSITSPNDDARGISLNTTMTSSSFTTTPSGIDSHESSQWQLSKVVDFSSIAVNETVGGSERTAWSTPTLDRNSVYYARVRYKGAGSGWSPWSDVIMFKTADITTTSFSTSRTTDKATNWNSSYTTQWQSSRATSRTTSRQTVVGNVYTTQYQTNFTTSWTGSRNTSVPQSKQTSRTVSRTTSWTTTYSVSRSTTKTTSRSTSVATTRITSVTTSRTTSKTTSKTTNYTTSYMYDDGRSPSSCLQGYYDGPYYRCMEPGVPKRTYYTTQKSTSYTTSWTTSWSTNRSTSISVNKTTSWSYSANTSVQTTETLSRNTSWTTTYTTNWSVDRSTDVNYSRSTSRTTEQILDNSDVRTTSWTTNYTSSWTNSRTTESATNRTTAKTTTFQTSRPTEV